MTKPTNDIVKELLIAMDNYKTIAEQLIDKLIAETIQPDRVEIEAGQYDKIQNAALLNGHENLSDNWWFDVHGEHCMFKNLTTGQTLEVSLGDKDRMGNLDPYFFYNFLRTTEKLNPLTTYFPHPFKDMLDFFQELEQQKILIHLYGVEYRKINA